MVSIGTTLAMSGNGMRNEFWPDDPAGFIFLGRACKQLGKARFGPQRTERLTTATSKYENQVTMDIERRAKLLNEEYPSSFYEELRRTSAVVDEIITACRSGAVTSAVRATTGGPIYPLPSTSWIGWEAASRCDGFQEFMSRGGAVADKKELGWIFLEKNGFEAFVGRTNVQILEGIHFSPYMRAMIEVIQELGISPEVQPKKERLVAVFLEKLEGLQPPLPDYLAKAMATFVRQPESQNKRGRPAKSGKRN